MPADASIYANYLRAPKTVQEYDAEAMQQQGNALALAQQRMQMNALQRQQAEDSTYKDVSRGFSDDFDSNYKKLIAAGLPRQAAEYRKAALEGEEKRSKINKEQGETLDGAIKRYRDQLSYIESPQAVARWYQAQYADPILGKFMSSHGTIEQALQEVPQDPAQFKAWRDQIGMGLDAFSKKLQEDAKIAETGRHNLATERTADGQLRVSQGNLKVAQDRLKFDKDQPKGQIVQSDQGVVLVDPRTGASTPVKAPDGTPLAPKLRDLPSAASSAIMSNAQSINKVQQAIDLLDGKNVGALKGDKAATGWKGYLPQPVLNRADPDGVDTRAMVTDIGSLVLHDRSGAAVTASETPRLLPFIPLPTDDPATARKKLVRFKQIYEQEQQAYLDAYSKEQGYKPPNVPAPSSSKPSMSAEDQQAVAWANANPNDPRAAKIKQRLGL